MVARAHPSTSRRARAATARGRHYLQAGRPDLALEAVSQVRDESPEAGEAMAVAGLALARMGQYRAARMALERALKLRPDQFEAAVTLGELNLDLGNARARAQVLETAARLRPREFGVWRILGHALDDLNDPAGAELAYQKALELRPKDREMLISMIGLLISSGQSDRADSWIVQALAVVPRRSRRILGFAARRAFDANRIDEALAFADRALQRDPRDPDAFAGTRAMPGRPFPVARGFARRGTRRDGGTQRPGPLNLLWIIETRLGLTDRAAQTLARRNQVQQREKLMDQLIAEVENHPEDPAVLWKMGQIASEAGSFLYASRCFEAALAVDPNYQPARETLAALKAAHPELAQNPTPSARTHRATRIPRTSSRPAR